MQKRRKVSKIKNYIDETVNEMVHQVTWPTWKELQSNTILVVVASVLFALMIFVMDYLFGISANDNATWQGALGFVYNMFN